MTFEIEKWRQLSLKKFESNNRRRPIRNLEGIDLTNQTTFIERKGFIDNLLDACFARHSILIRSPPCTGKTSVSQLLYRKLYEDSSCLPISLTMLVWDSSISFEDGFAKNSGFGCSWESILESVESFGSEFKIVLIVDEAQMLYSYVQTQLWRQMKNGLANHAHIIFISAFGETVRNTLISTPFEFENDQIFGLDHLLFSREEFQEYIRLGYLLIEEFPLIQDIVYCATNGHIGMLKKIERVFHDYQKTKLQQGMCIQEIWQESAIRQILVSGSMALEIYNSVLCGRYFLRNNFTVGSSISK